MADGNPPSGDHPPAGNPPPGTPPPGDPERVRLAFLSHVRHQLRTPLNAIIGYSEMLLEDLEAEAQHPFTPDLLRVNEEGKRLVALVDELLHPQAQDAELDIDGLAGRIQHRLRTPLTHVIGYSEMLMEEAEDAGESDSVTSAMTADLERIHSAARDLLKMAGSIVRGSALEMGVTEVTVDAAEVPASVRELISALAEENTASQADSTGGRVLVVDDNAANRDILSRQLERHGHEPTAVRSGEEALEALRNGDFDLVLLDMLMPGLSGFEVLGEIRSDRGLAHIPVIMISALDEIDSVARCIELGAEDYLPKPFNPVLLWARVGASLEKKRLRDREAEHLARIEREKRRADQLLEVILPREIAEELKLTDAVQPRRVEEVAVLFTDIVGFTPYCHGREPEEIVERLDALVGAFEEIAVKYGLEKIKTIGDAFMAAAGLLSPVQNPAFDAVRCGLELRDAAQRLPPGWQLRVGVHVGPVVAGVVGRRKYLYDLWGDAVNTAARVESHGVVGEVCVSAQAWERVAPLCEGTSLGVKEVKGKGKLELFRVDSVRVEQGVPA